MCSITSLNGAMSFMRSWLVMVAGTVRMHTMALRLTSSVRDVILLQTNSEDRSPERKQKSTVTNLKSRGTYLVLYRCITPWMISTEGFPLKKEMWSGSCLEGESGAEPAASLLFWAPSLSPALTLFCSDETLAPVPPPLSGVGKIHHQQTNVEVVYGICSLQVSN